VERESARVHRAHRGSGVGVGALDVADHVELTVSCRAFDVGRDGDADALAHSSQPARILGRPPLGADRIAALL